jgi:rubrerythrin
MSLSTFLSELFSGSDSGVDAPTTATTRGDNGPSVTVVSECRNCGTNVSDGTTRCPACDGEDIVTYSID